MENPTILVIGTLDTKLEEILFLRDIILDENSCRVRILDVGIEPRNEKAFDIRRLSLSDLVQFARPDTSSLDRETFISRIIPPATSTVRDLINNGEIHALVSAGGSCGTSLATAIMRAAAPVGLPKLMVSTIASGDVKPLVEETDITLMYSVVDIAGLNSILSTVLSNAAAAIAGMARAYYQRSLSTDTPPNTNPKKRIAITMFGVTTPCVDQIRALLPASQYEIYVFHATGSGGRAMERLIAEDQIDAVIDLTTTEIADHLFGGNMSAGPDRLKAAAEKGIPQVVSVGACDMVNFGPKETVPERYTGRHLYVHNPAVTLMRTTRQENDEIGRFIAKALRENAAKPEKITVLLPGKGVSMLDAEGQAFWDQEADEVLFRAIEDGCADSKITVKRTDNRINEEAFSKACASQIEELISI